MKLDTLMKNKKLVRIALVLIAGAVTYLFNQQAGHQGGHDSSQQKAPIEVESAQGLVDEAAKVASAHQRQQSGVWVTVKGSVIKTLPDDNKGSRHQRFLVSLAQGPTLLVAHNIDLAPKAPLKKGDSVWMRGRYEWNNKGGVLHWTHHDPKLGSRDGPKEGWIQLNGKRYE